MPGEPNPETKKGNRARSARTLLLLVAPFAVVLLLLGAYFLYRSSLTRQVEARLAALKAAGLPATCTELDEWCRRPPDGQNAAELYERAEALLSTPAAVSNAEEPPVKAAPTAELPSEEDEGETPPDDRPLGHTFGIPERGETLSAETLAAARIYLVANQEPLRLLHEAARRPECRWNVDYSKGPETPVPVARCRRIGHILCLEATVASREGDGSRAIDALECLVTFAGHVGTEPFLISFLLRGSLLAIGVHSLEDTASHVVLTDELLSRSIDMVHSAELKISLARALVGERCCQVWFFQQPFQKSVSVLLEYPFRVRPWDVSACYYLWSGGRERDLLIALDTIDRLAALDTVPFPERLDRLNAIITWFWSRVGTDAPRRFTSYFLSPCMMPGFLGHGERSASVIARLRAARTALAVERFRLATGRLPAALVEVAPRYLPELPLDPFDGKPLRYKILERGFVVYSIGANKLDDGGVSGSRHDNGDITFTIDR
jgi:hypothetical protein